jgi:Reverse transcriptase (RNA-dependent DNA polymerase)
MSRKAEVVKRHRRELQERRRRINNQGYTLRPGEVHKAIFKGSRDSTHGGLTAVTHPTQDTVTDPAAISDSIEHFHRCDMSKQVSRFHTESFPWENTNNPDPYEIRRTAAEHGLLPRLTEKPHQEVPGYAAERQGPWGGRSIKRAAESPARAAQTGTIRVHSLLLESWRQNAYRVEPQSYAAHLQEGRCHRPSELPSDRYSQLRLKTVLEGNHERDPGLPRTAQDAVLQSIRFQAEHRNTNQALRYLKRLLEDAEWTSRDLYMLAVDFRSAFNSVDQDCLYATMETMGIPADACQAVKGIYRDARTVITFPGGQTNSITVNRGTIQGDTLSPLLFLVAIDPLLRWLQQGGRGCRCGSSPAEDQHACAAVAYADDLTTLTDDIIEIKTQVKKIELFSRWSSLRLSPQKCALTGILHRSGEVLHTTETYKNDSPTDWEKLQPILQDVLIEGHPVALKRADEPIKYLGVLLMMTQSWDQQVDAIVTDMKTKYEQLNRAQLGQVYKRVIEENNILGSVKYAMDVLHLTETQMGEIENARARGIKRLLKLPNSTDSQFCRLPRSKGGCGWPPSSAK